MTKATPAFDRIRPRLDTASSTRAGLASWLEQGILSGVFALGTSLPSERDLMTQFGVSRATVREALRTLAAHGLIEPKRGRNGGSYVCGPSQSAVSNTLSLLIKGQDFRYVDLVAAREAIEPMAAWQAAEFRTRTDLSNIEEKALACEANLHDIGPFAEANLEFHLAVVDASHNPLFQAFMRSIAPALETATDIEEFGLQTRKSVVGTHWQIYNAIRDGDKEAARRRMARHVGAYGEALSTMDLAKVVA